MSIGNVVMWYIGYRNSYAGVLVYVFVSCVSMGTMATGVDLKK